MLLVDRNHNERCQCHDFSRTKQGNLRTQVLWRASLENDSSLLSVYKSTHAILFLGTPHRGSEWAQSGDTLRRIATVAGFDTSNKNIRALEIDSSELNTCQENFM